MPILATRPVTIPVQSVRAWWRRFRIRLGSWEYWPLHLLYMPVYVYWLWLSLRARHPVFFAAANPAIPFGGLFGDAKGDILAGIPAAWLPATVRLPAQARPAAAWVRVQAAGLDFPLIAKPDLGERGLMVEKLDDLAAFYRYFDRDRPATLVQTYIDEPVEVGILYHRQPGAARGEISSLTLKDFLHVEGDGVTTVAGLMARSPRASLQLPTLLAQDPVGLARVPAPGEQVTLMPIGNHCRGTTFLDGRHEIDEALRARFDAISAALPGIYFGRFDIRCRSLTDLRAGRHFYILEINGVKAEPTHIYQPGFPLRTAYRTLFAQWDTIFAIAQANRAAGVGLPSFGAALRALGQQLAYRRRWS